MYVYKFKLIFVYLLLLVLLTACGHPIPTASMDLINQKKAILVLTTPSLNKPLQTQLMQTLNSWKQTELITYEWVQQVNIVDDLLINKIKQTPYSYIIVIGTDLKPSTLVAAEKTQDKRWIVLSDATHLEAVSSAALDNIALYQLNAAVVTAQWDEWVKQQQQLHTVNELNNSVGKDTYGVTNSLIIPTIDFQKSGSILLIWDAIWAEQLKVIQLNSFEKGIHYYTAQQMMIKH
jgi:Neuraminidase (sialidase)